MCVCVCVWRMRVLRLPVLPASKVRKEAAQELVEHAFPIESQAGCSVKRHPVRRWALCLLRWTLPSPTGWLETEGAGCDRTVRTMDELQPPEAFLESGSHQLAVLCAL